MRWLYAAHTKTWLLYNPLVITENSILINCSIVKCQLRVNPGVTLKLIGSSLLNNVLYLCPGSKIVGANGETIFEPVEIPCAVPTRAYSISGHSGYGQVELHRCGPCGKNINNDGSTVAWKCKVCGNRVCRECTLTIRGKMPKEYYWDTLCSLECWEADGRPSE